MKCPKCGADSHVAATRKYKDVLLRRNRTCFNEHTFATYEVFAGNLDRRTIADTRRGVEAGTKAWKRKQAVLRQPETSATELAAQLGITEARVRQLRAGTR